MQNIYPIQLYSELAYPSSQNYHSSSEQCNEHLDSSRSLAVRSTELRNGRAYPTNVPNFFYYRRFDGVESPESLENAPAPKFIQIRIQPTRLPKLPYRSSQIQYRISSEIFAYLFRALPSLFRKIFREQETREAKLLFAGDEI